MTTAHLCLLAPKTDRDCALRVGDPKQANAKRPYVEGEALVFDDAFEHDLFHDGEANSGDLVLVAVHFFHTKLSKAQRQSEVRNALEAVQRRKIKTEFGSLATEAAIRNATHEALGDVCLM